MIELEFENKLLEDKKIFETQKFEKEEDVINFLKLHN